MKGKDLLDKLENIDDRYIAESEEKASHKPARKWSILAASLLVLSSLCILLPLSILKTEDKPLPKAEPDQIEETRPEETMSQNDTPPEYKEKVSYNDLYFTLTENEEKYIPSEDVMNSEAMGDVAPFYETEIAGCDLIEGKVTDVYEKRYEYTLPAHKFKDGDRSYCYTVSVIYEFEITRTWRGTHKAGEKILIEDMQLFCGTQFYMQKGHSYLVPIYDAGEKIAILGLNADKAEGDIKRQTPYSTRYPYHPQIEITVDGYYFFPDDWTTLATDNAIRVTDVKFDWGTVYYEDRMLLLDPESFEKHMKILLAE